MVRNNNNKGKAASAKAARRTTLSQKKGTGVPNSQNAHNQAVKFSTQISRAPDPYRRMKAAEVVCSLTDPFCQAAKGAKWADGNGLSALPAQIRGHFAVGTWSNGGNVVMINPGFPYSYVASGALVAGNYTLDTAWSQPSGANPFINFVNTYRVVTAGIVIRNVAPALTTGGYIIVRRISEPQSLGSTYNSGSVLGTFVNTIPLKSGLEVPMIFTPQGSDSRAFFTKNVADEVPNESFDTITVEIVGGATEVTVLDIEFVYNIEFTLNTAYQSLASLVPNTNKTSTQAVALSQKVSSNMSGVIHNSVTSFGAAALTAI